MDALQMHRLKEAVSHVDNQHKFDESTIVTITDTRQNNISTGEIAFDCSILKNEAPIWADSWLEVPFAIYSSGNAVLPAALSAAGASYGVPAPANTAFTTNTKIAVKCALTSLIGGISVSTVEGGAQIVNEQSMSTPIRNALNLLLESTVDWIDSAGPGVHFFGKDTNLPYAGTGVAAGALNAQLQGASLMATYGAMSVVPDVSVGAVGIDPTVNTALLSRITILGSLTSSTIGTVNVNGVANAALCFNACIPLRLLLDLCQQLDFPLPNCPLRFAFYPAGMNSMQGFNALTLPVQSPNYSLATATTYNTGTIGVATSGVVTGTGTTFTSAMQGGVLTLTSGPNQNESFVITLYTSATSITVLPAPAAAIAAGTTYTLVSAPGVLDVVGPAVPNLPALAVAQQFTDKWGYSPVCALKVRCVKFDASDEKAVAHMYEKGMKKRIEFISSDLPPIQYRAQPLPGTNVSQQVSWTIGTYVRPWRVTMLCMPAGTLASPLNVFPGAIGGFQGPNGAGTFFLRGVNMAIDGTPFFRANIDGQRELYRLLELESNGMSGTTYDGCQIGYADFLNGLNPYMFNLSRNSKIQHNNSVRIGFTGTVGVVGTSPGAYDLYALVETIKTVTFHLSDSKVTVQVADGVH